MIENTVSTMVAIVGDTPVIPFGIRFFSPDDIECHLANEDGSASIILTAGEDFEVESKADYSTGANITLLVGSANVPELPTGRKLAIMRVLPVVQTLHLPELGKLPSAAIEQRLDRIVMILQQHDERLGRCWQDAPTGAGLIFAELLAKMEELLRKAEEAAASAASASSSATRAGGYADNAATSAGNASQAALSAAGSATEASGFSASASQAATDAAASAASAGSSASSAATSAGNAASSAASAAESAEEAAEAAGGKWFNMRSNIAIHAQNYSYTAGGEAYVECEASGVLMHQESATPTYSARLLYHFYNASGEEYMTMEGNTVLTGVIGADNHVTWGLSTDSYLPAISGDGEARTLGAITELRIPLRMNHVDITTDRTLASVTFNPQN